MKVLNDKVFNKLKQNDSEYSIDIYLSDQSDYKLY